MTEEFIIGLARESLFTVLLLGAPVLGLGLLVGLVVSIFQATTQINEQTLTFIPKMVAIFLAIIIFGPWMMRVMVDFTANLFATLPNLIR